MLFRLSCLFDLYVTFHTHAKNGYILFPERPSAVIYFGYALIYILPLPLSNMTQIIRLNDIMLDFYHNCRPIIELYGPNFLEKITHDPAAAGVTGNSFVIFLHFCIFRL